MIGAKATVHLSFAPRISVVLTQAVEMERPPVLLEENFVLRVWFRHCFRGHGSSDDVLSGFCYLGSEFGKAPPMCFRLLFLERKELSIDFPLRLGHRLPGWYLFIDKRFLRLISLWFMMRLHVASSNNRHVDAHCQRARRKQQLSTFLAEHAMVAELLGKIIEKEPL